MSTEPTTYARPAAEALVAAQAAYDAVAQVAQEARMQQSKTALLTEAREHFDGVTDRASKQSLAQDLAEIDTLDTPERKALAKAERVAYTERWVVNGLTARAQRRDPLDLSGASKRAAVFGAPAGLIEAAIDAAAAWHTDAVWASIAALAETTPPVDAARYVRDMVQQYLVDQAAHLTNRSSSTGANLDKDAKVQAYAAWLRDAKFAL